MFISYTLGGFYNFKFISSYVNKCETFNNKLFCNCVLYWMDYVLLLGIKYT